MTGTAPFALLLVLGLGTIGLPEAQGVTVPLPAAEVVGVVAGLLLFRLLAGRWVSPRRVTAVLPTRLARIAVAAALEEIAWRGFLLVLVGRAIGPLPALAATSVLFALAHGSVPGRSKLVHIATGGVFGGVYLATGHLSAAIVAHAVYNGSIAVGVACRSVPGSAPQLAATVVAPVAEAVRVVKRFAGGRGLAGVDLRLEHAEVLALLGPNGAGKSTLVGLLLGLRRPDAGLVRLFGRDPRLPAVRARAGTVLQEATFPATLRVGELVRLVAAHFPDPVPCAELLDRFALSGCARRQVGGLSGGTRRRVAVALAFVGRPRVVFLDEPTVGLDLEARRRVWDVIRDHASAGGSALLTTHQFDEAGALADRIAVIDGGRIVAGGTPSDLRAEFGSASLEEAVVRVLASAAG